MSPTAVGHCSHCLAVVNRHWPRCLVCHAPLTAPSCETGSANSAAPVLDAPLALADHAIEEAVRVS